MKKFLILVLVCLLTNMFALAEARTANTEVYVRDIDTGEIVGSLYTGDTVEVVDSSKGWLKINISGKEYKVWGEYFGKSQNSDDVEVVSKIRKSKSATDGIINVEKHSLSEDSDLYELGEVLWG